MQNNFPKTQLILSLLFLGLSLFAFLFLYKKINENNEMSEQILTNWQMEANRRRDIELFNSAIKIVEKEKVSLGSHFAQSSDIVPFLDTIEKLALEAGTKSEVVAVSISKDNTELIVELKASGSFDSIYKLLTLLENSPYELDFSLVDVRREESDMNIRTSKWNAFLRIKLLSFIS